MIEVREPEPVDSEDEEEHSEEKEEEFVQTATLCTLSSAVPQHQASITVHGGTKVKFSVEGQGTISIVGSMEEMEGEDYGVLFFFFSFSFLFQPLFLD